MRRRVRSGRMSSVCLFLFSFSSSQLRVIMTIRPSAEKPEPKFGHMPKPDPYAEIKGKSKYFLDQ